MPHLKAGLIFALYFPFILFYLPLFLFEVFNEFHTEYSAKHMIYLGYIVAAYARHFYKPLFPVNACTQQFSIGINTLFAKHFEQLFLTGNTSRRSLDGT